MNVKNPTQKERQQEKTKQMLKQNAKKGDTAACKILAREIVNSKKAVSRMYQSKAQMNSVMVRFLKCIVLLNLSVKIMYTNIYFPP